MTRSLVSQSLTKDTSLPRDRRVITVTSSYGILPLNEQYSDYLNMITKFLTLTFLMMIDYFFLLALSLMASCTFGTPQTAILWQSLTLSQQFTQKLLSASSGVAIPKTSNWETQLTISLQWAVLRSSTFGLSIPLTAKHSQSWLTLELMCVITHALFSANHPKNSYLQVPRVVISAVSKSRTKLWSSRRMSALRVSSAFRRLLMIRFV